MVVDLHSHFYDSACRDAAVSWFRWNVGNSKNKHLYLRFKTLSEERHYRRICGESEG